MTRILIKNGLLVDPASQRQEMADINIADGRIAAISAPGQGQPETRSIDASGLTVCPGLVDCCARLREPGDEHKATIESEVRAAAHAGITTLCCPPDTDPVIDEPAVVELIHKKSTAAGGSRVVTLGALTAGLKGEHLSEMGALKDAGCVGVSNARRPLGNTLILKRAFAYAATFGLSVFIEPEDYWLSLDGCAHDGKVASRLGLRGIPKSAETVAIASAIQMIRETGVRTHFGRLSTAEAVTMIGRAKHDQLPISADVSAHQLHLTEHDISNFNSSCHVRPPFRTLRDMEALRQGVADGVIDAICSDHQPHEADAKRAPFASTEPGISSLETLLPLALRLTECGLALPTVLAALTHKPASILGLDRGHLSVGAPADLCIFDPDEDWQLTPDTLLSRGQNTPFIGWHLQGRVRHTLIGGRGPAGD